MSEDAQQAVFFPYRSAGCDRQVLQQLDLISPQLKRGVVLLRPVPDGLLT